MAEKSSLLKLVSDMVKTAVRERLEEPDLLRVEILGKIRGKLDVREELKKELEEAVKEILE